MKKTLIVVSGLWLVAAQSNAAELETDKQRMSYIVGQQVAGQLKNEGFEWDEAALIQGIRDAGSGAASKLSNEEIQATFQRAQQQRMEAIQKQAEANKKAGQAFLDQNKSKPDVKVTASGLQYKVITEGNGKMPNATDTVEVHYRGTLIDETEFDSSYSRGQPASFPVNGVIQGWQEALQLMKEGSKWQIVIPSELAYGSRGAAPKIGPDATLIFDVELLKVN